MESRISGITIEHARFIMHTAATQDEKDAAVHNILESSFFSPADIGAGPYHLHVGLDNNCLTLDVAIDGKEEVLKQISIPLSPLRRIIKDYAMICDSYLSAIDGANPAKVEAIDMGRRSVHNEGSEILQSVVEEQVEMDFHTARNFFTLVYVLYKK